jgi:hypothetical protein
MTAGTDSGGEAVQLLDDGTATPGDTSSSIGGAR